MTDGQKIGLLVLGPPTLSLLIRYLLRGHLDDGSIFAWFGFVVWGFSLLIGASGGMTGRKDNAFGLWAVVILFYLLPLVVVTIL